VIIAAASAGEVGGSGRDEACVGAPVVVVTGAEVVVVVVAGRAT
jgi:hypothetical protein